MVSALRLITCLFRYIDLAGIPTWSMYRDRPRQGIPKEIPGPRLTSGGPFRGDPFKQVRIPTPDTERGDPDPGPNSRGRGEGEGVALSGKDGRPTDRRTRVSFWTKVLREHGK